MAIPSYIVGTAAAETLSRLGALHRPDAPQYRPVDLINIAGYSVAEAHELLLADAAGARELILNAASRLIRAAEQLEPHARGRNIAPLRVAS
ncbi:hypothetical protein [Sphingomonas sp. VDB2]|uniref:hypothetical protein n=1 Tax=Sphingomonas sp. VDB2 TaxID=3228751 RepID=UPI003A80ADD8